MYYDMILYYIIVKLITLYYHFELRVQYIYIVLGALGRRRSVRLVRGPRARGDRRRHKHGLLFQHQK